MFIANENKAQEKIVNKMKTFASNLANKDNLDIMHKEMMRQLQDADLRFILLKFLECFYLEKMDFCCLDKVKYLSFDAEKEIDDGKIKQFK